MSDFMHLVEIELAEARLKFPAGMHGGHEAFGVIREELDEFWDEVRAQDHRRIRMLKELVQTAAMCARAAEDLELITVSQKQKLFPFRGVIEFKDESVLSRNPAQVRITIPEGLSIVNAIIERRQGADGDYYPVVEFKKDGNSDET